MTIAAVAKNLVNLFYPLHCPVCGKSLDPLGDALVCGTCAAAIRRTPRPYCAVCGRPVSGEGATCPECRRASFHFDRAYSACLYEDGLKELIHRFKFGSKLPLEKFLAGLMISFLRDNETVARGVDLVTFVPLHGRRLRERGFNQSQLLAREIAVAFDLGVADTLEKRSAGKHQNELSREKRLTNLDGAFRPKKGVSLAGRTILVIDDVMTTGATLNECARALRSTGAGEIRCLTLARGV